MSSEIPTPEREITQEQRDCDHDWKFKDDSFDHEYGVKVIHYEQCEKCDLTREVSREEL